MNAPPTEEPPPVERERETRADEHEREIEQHEAYEYWGYLFKPDKTGTDKLKSLLRGLKDVMNERYEPSDQPDLTPNQLAHFYRDLHGNYDQLFLGTPNESIAFIYKSLGCLHSLQPPAYTHATAFTDPTVPALKTEGWIMWQTIQVLLGPEEHSSFLREAVQMYDVRDHDTGEIFPKILPRECFPREPDKHMVAWYEGVSERLRKEADEEERHNRIEVEHVPENRRIHGREHPPRREEGVLSDEEGSVDSRGPALAYFRNPLYRHVDGRPSIVRRNSKRPALSPRQTMMDKGKEAANTFGRIARNVGSPHLWDGGRGSSRSRDRDHRRKSHPDNHYQYPEDAPPPTSAGAYDARREHSGHSGHRRRRSSQLERPERPVSAAMSADDEWDQSEASPVYSPPQHPTGSNSSRQRHHGSRPVSRDQQLRHSRSHEPTPSQEKDEDYFAGYDDPAKRRNSAHDKPFTPPPAPAPNGVGMSFGPSGGPLFASHVARQPQPPPAQRPPPGPGPDSYEGGPPMQHPSIRRAQGAGRYPSRSPEPGVGGRPPPPMDPRDRPLDPRDRDPRDPRDMRDPRDRDPRDPRNSRYDSPGRPPPDHRPRYEQSPAPYDDLPPQGPPPPGGGGNYPPRDRRPGSGRMSGSDLDQYYSGEDRRGGRPKQTRFADRPVSGSGPPETGVSGRRYPEGGGGWRRGS